MPRAARTELIATAIFAGVATAALSSAADALGPAIASDWATLDVSQIECLNRGEAAIRRMNFGAIELTRYSRFGQNGDYTISVRCIPEKGVILFLAAGPSQQRALELQIELHQNYLK